MTLKIIGNAKDIRSNTPIIYAQIGVDEYLKLVGENFDEFHIQRKREKHKAYIRMRKDIIEGALLPTITLSVKTQFVDELMPHIESANISELEKLLGRPGQVNILDGLQRTFILNDLKQDKVEFKQDQKLLLEFWLEKEVKHLIYRLIVLNAGQKPMSMRHQVELLFATIKEKLEDEIENLVIYMERDNGKRNRPKKFPLDRLVTAYESFLTKSPEINRDNIVAQRLIEGNIFDTDEEELNENFDRFKYYLKVYSELDEEVFRIYSDSDIHGENWLAEENVINTFFAAISDFGSSESRIRRINVTLEKLLRDLRSDCLGEDPFAIQQLEQIKQGIDSKKSNVGFALRKLTMNGFKEYFREEGEKTFKQCWISEAE